MINSSSVIDYYAFFHVMLHSHVSTLRDCLVEWILRADPPSSFQTFKAEHHFKLLPGEFITFSPNEKLHYTVYSGKNYSNAYFHPGQMVYTNYRLILVSERQDISFNLHSRFDVPDFFKVLSIPFASIYKIKILQPRNSIHVTTKNYQAVQIILPGCLHNTSKVETFLQMMSGMAFMKNLKDFKNHIFAFKYKQEFNSSVRMRLNSGGSEKVSGPGFRPSGGSEKISVRGSGFSAMTEGEQSPRSEVSSVSQSALSEYGKEIKGWEVRDLMQEYKRQGIFGSKEWKVVRNDKYDIAESYPYFLAVPEKIPSGQLRVAASFRSQNRLPVITYLHSNSAVLVRSSQPLVGISRNFSHEDAFLLNLYRLKGIPDNAGEHKLYIMDARGRIAAGLNMMAGKGTEEISEYKDTELFYGGIDNIHEIRAAGKALSESLSPQSHPFGDVQHVLATTEVDFSAVARWLKHIRQILASSVLVAEKLELEGNSVLVHCSDGWDRTTQLCALAQLLIDPFYRTIHGLAVLIEKEWCSFGHKFQDRVGSGYDATVLPDERSPVFIQFLDCLYQLLQQFPTSFEYNDQLLLFLANHSSSGLFGNFLGNHEKERILELSVHIFTKSIWDYVFQKKQDLFINPLYQEYEGALWPSLAMQRLRLWDRYWNRWNIAAHPNALQISGMNTWIDDWGEGAI